jgi:5-methylcytosine-specific restriction endonuclease McrA
MINFIKKIFLNKISSLSIEEINVLALPRSSKWRKVRSQFLKDNPKCAVCGSEKNIVPHHIVPVHMDPSKELDQDNLIPLCENKNFNCHFFFGHLKNWTKYNSNILEDAKIWSEKIRS